jgi:hypothetical protein
MPLMLVTSDPSSDLDSPSEEFSSSSDTFGSASEIVSSQGSERLALGASIEPHPWAHLVEGSQPGSGLEDREDGDVTVLTQVLHRK